MAKLPPLSVLTANRLADGRVVYHGADGWRPSLDAATLVRDQAEADAADEIGRAAVAERLVVEPYLVEVEFVEDGVRPARLRERIRNDGPTTGNSLYPEDIAKAS